MKTDWKFKLNGKMKNVRCIQVIGDATPIAPNAPYSDQSVSGAASQSRTRHWKLAAWHTPDRSLAYHSLSADSALQVSVSHPCRRAILIKTEKKNPANFSLFLHVCRLPCLIFFAHETFLHRMLKNSSRFEVGQSRVTLVRLLSPKFRLHALGNRIQTLFPNLQEFSWTAECIV